ncbi:class F sortase [Amycolatopsis antarctica]|uniref:Class F sortase n=1 Tax=Amycolatopsis antarctica TaxID=1854586 RepID=A0A263D597_9PSEU|nr:class F sortase [Amycolatopsis antarctica]OZM73603.1 class F sortase [Amycolatopsis antarctica]
MRAEAPAPRRRTVAPYLIGAAALLAAELVVAGTLLLPDGTIAGRALAAPVPPAAAAPVLAPPEPVQPPAEPPPPPTAPAPEPQAPAPVAAEPPAPEPPLHGQRPGTIRLPDGGTATLVRQEVVGPEALLPVPDDLGEATWWGAGLDAPGGASLFAGHVNWQGRAGPFAELWNARVGERVTVKDTDGTEWNYDIAQVFTLHKDELPQRAGELFGQDGTHRVVLVTCGGRWLGGSTGYAENRVVVAEPV